MKKYALLLLFISTSIFSQEVKETYQKVKVFYDSSEDLQHLEEMGVPVDHAQFKKNVFFITDFSLSEIELIKQAGHRVEIIIEDSVAHFLEENAKRSPSRNLSCATEASNSYTTPTNFQLGDMGGYFTYQEVLDQLDEMKEQYPDLITEAENIGSFLTNGQPDNSTTPSIGSNGIKWVRISDNPNVDEDEPEILYSAIHHAREPMSLSQLIYYMWYLLENYETSAEVQGIVNNTELYFVPVINPDGYLYNEKIEPNGGGFWRKNRRNNGNGTFGVDNNRNYEFYIDGNPNNGMWGGEGSSGNPDSEIYRGTAPFSEVENQAMKWFVEQHEFVLAFNNHSFGDLLLHPFGYADNEITEDNDLFVALGAELVSQNGYSSILSSLLYPAAGDSDDFMYGTVGTHDPIFAYTPEIGDTFWPASSQIIPTCNEMMYFNLTAAKMVGNFASAKETTPLFIGGSAIINTSIDVRRLGINGNGDFDVSISAVSDNINTIGDAISITGLELLETETISIPVTLNDNTEVGDLIVFNIVVNNGIYDSTTTITKYFGEQTIVFQDDGSSADENFNNNGWATTTQTFVSAPSSITDSPNGNYQNNTEDIITLSEPLDLTEALGASVSFYANWEIETGWDFVQFEISINNGSSWIPQCGLYTTTGSDNGTQPEGEPIYDGSQNDWVQEQINLSDYLGETILARFRLVSDNFERRDGFYFDDLTFNIVEPSDLNTDEVNENTFSIYPNPTKNQLNIVSTVSKYTVEIYSLQGQLLFDTVASNQRLQINLDKFSSGLYLVKVATDNSSQSFKVLKM